MDYVLVMTLCKYIWELLGLFECFNETVAFQTATQTLNEAIKKVDPYTNTEFWGELKFLLGTAYSMAGELQMDNSKLEIATEHFNNALAIIEKQSLPTLWAKLQNNLGIVLVHIGERTSDFTKLAHAASSMKKALVACTLPSEDLFAIYINFGNVFCVLGKFTDKTEYYAKSIALYKIALRFYTQTDSPENYFKVRLALAETLRSLGESRRDKACLKRSLKFLQIVLRDADKNKHLLLWAKLQNNLAITLGTIGSICEDIRASQKAYELACFALDAARDHISPSIWFLFHSKGNAALQLGQQNRDVSLIKIAIATYESGIKIISPTDNRLPWEYLSEGLSFAYHALSEMDNS